MSYLLNKLDHTLNLKNGYMIIKAGFSTTNPLSESDLVDPSIVDAISRSWAALSDVVVVPADEPPAHSVSPADPYKGLTEAQMKAELAAKEDKPAASGTLLGQEGLQKSAPATSEAIGVPATETTEPINTTPDVVNEDAPAPSKKSPKTKA